MFLNQLPFIKTLHPHGKPFEIRIILSDDSIIAGTFSDPQQAINSLEQIAPHTPARGYYLTLNSIRFPVAPVNTLQPIKNAAKDKHIAHRAWLLLDIDSARPKPRSTNATDTELDHALALRDHVYQILLSEGWGTPIIGMSGNGGTLLYPCDLPADDQGLAAQVLHTLARLFNTPNASLDTSVSNPSRITKLLGTLTRKGTHSEERPQRVSRVDHLPEAFTPLTASMLVQWLHEHGEIAQPIATQQKIQGKKRLPNLAQAIIEGQLTERFTSNDMRLTQFVNSLVGAKYDLNRVTKLSEEHAPLLGIEELSMSKRTRKIERAYLDSTRQQQVSPSKGRLRAQRFARRAEQNIPAFGKGSYALARLRTYLAACKLCEKAGRTEEVALDSRSVSLLSGINRDTTSNHLNWLCQHGLMTNTWKAAIVIDTDTQTRQVKGKTLANRYTLHEPPTTSRTAKNEGGNKVENTKGSPMPHSSMSKKRNGALDSLLIRDVPVHDVFRDRIAPPAVTFNMVAKRGWVSVRRRAVDSRGREVVTEVIKGLGASAFAVWCAMRDDVPLTAVQIAEVTTLHVKTVRAVLTTFATGRRDGIVIATPPQLNLAVRVKGGFIRSPQADLDEAARLIGTYGATEDLEARYRADRREFGLGAYSAVGLFARAGVVAVQEEEKQETLAR